MRQYEPVWIEVKLQGFCKISAHRAYHKRIIKAVVKEKDLDLGFKLELSERYPPQISVMRSSREGSVITFTIIYKPLITIDSI
jgi:hypothetical protein